MHSEKGKFLAFDQKLISKSSLHPHSSVARSSDSKNTSLISQEPTAVSVAAAAASPQLLSFFFPNFGNGHGHKMEEIGLKSTHKIRALELFSGDLFFTFLQTSRQWLKIDQKSLVLQKLLRIVDIYSALMFPKN